MIRSWSADNWTSRASVRPDGTAAEFEWKSSEPSPEAKFEDDARVFTESISLRTDPAKGLTTVTTHYNEEAPNQSNRGYRAVFESSTNGLLVFDQR